MLRCEGCQREFAPKGHGPIPRFCSMVCSHREDYKKNRSLRLTQAREIVFRRKYNLSTDDVERMHQDQGGFCGLIGCQRPAQVVDHDHRTGKIRMLLCSMHNRAIGQFSDDPELLRAAAAYLEAFAEAS